MEKEIRKKRRTDRGERRMENGMRKLGFLPLRKLGKNRRRNMRGKRQENGERRSDNG